jgi:hypothetical protein
MRRWPSSSGSESLPGRPPCPGAAHKEFKTSIFGAIPRFRMGCGYGGKPFVSMSLRLAWAGRDVNIYVQFFAKKVKIYLPFSTQKRCNPFSFFMVLEDICSAFEGFY